MSSYKTEFIHYIKYISSTNSARAYRKHWWQVRYGICTFGAYILEKDTTNLVLFFFCCCCCCFLSIVNKVINASNLNFSLPRIQFSSVQSLSRVWLFATTWIAARQASLSIIHSRSLPRLTSVESVMPSSHLILCRPLLLLPPIPPSISLFQWVNSSHKAVKVLEFQL